MEHNFLLQTTAGKAYSRAPDELSVSLMLRAADKARTLQLQAADRRAISQAQLAAASFRSAVLMSLVNLRY